MGLWEALKTILGPHHVGRIESLLREFQEKINYRFRDPGLLRIALTHRSFAKSGNDTWLPSNERLEFLGDAVLGLIVSEFLYAKYPEKLEGGLTKFKSLLVNETTLSRTAETLGLGKYILLSEEEDRAGGRSRPSITADALESIIAAMYLDGGLVSVRPFVTRHLLSQVDTIVADKTFRNYKGDLLEYLQASGAGMPRYEVTDEEGPEHEKTFVVSVYCNGEAIGFGSGMSKKDAEQKAAAQALARLRARERSNTDPD
jgi:ribonuclease-3